MADLIGERLPLLSEAGRAAASRLLEVLTAKTLGVSQSTVSTGTWLRQIWMNLGGADCCDSTALANVNLLWACVDQLQAGQEDLLGPALTSALDKLTALPNPQASSDCGVQLMTIHKSKGLEFEVVIVPDLQAKTSTGERKMLAWLERGLEPGPETAFDDAETTDGITEFLVAPLPTKGENSGRCRIWVDRVYRERELQETRRILYVAATRAREELHLFARLEYKVGVDGSLTLIQPAAGLLRTAWPAFEEEIRARFEEFKLSRADGGKHPEEWEGQIETIAASARQCIFAVPAPGMNQFSSNRIRRLPADLINARIDLEGFSSQRLTNASDANSRGLTLATREARSRGHSGLQCIRSSRNWPAFGLDSKWIGHAMRSNRSNLALLRRFGLPAWGSTIRAARSRGARIGAACRSGQGRSVDPRASPGRCERGKLDRIHRRRIDHDPSGSRLPGRPCSAGRRRFHLVDC